MQRREVAEYVGSLTRELAKLARDVELATLAYLLDMAALESSVVVKENEGSQASAAKVTEAA
jgi:hypothetical protein